MEIVLLDQTKVFIFASALGILLGLVYDVFAIISDGTKRLSHILDVIYCVIFMAGFIALVQLRAGGEIRWYIPGGMVIGLALYFLGLSDYVRLTGEGLRKAVGALKKYFLKAASAIASLFEMPRGS